VKFYPEERQMGERKYWGKKVWDFVLGLISKVQAASCDNNERKNEVGNFEEGMWLKHVKAGEEKEQVTSSPSNSD